MFTIVVFFNNKNNEKNLKNFFLQMSNLSKINNKFEFIFVIENNYNIIDLVNEFKNNSKSIVKFIFSSKQMSFNNSLLNVIEAITNEYTLIISDTTSINEKFINDAIKILEKNNVDILEFKPLISGLIKWNPSNRQLKDNWDKVLKINEHNSIVALSFPFIFNKFYSTNLIIKTIKEYSKEINLFDFSSFIYTKFTYLLFLNANTYYYASNLSLGFPLLNEETINFNEIINSWNRVEDISILLNKYIPEIKYAKLFYLKIMLCSFFSDQGKTKFKLLMNKNNLLKQKYFDKLNFILDKEFRNFNLENKYMILNGVTENKILKENYSISKWGKLLKELEV